MDFRYCSGSASGSTDYEVKLADTPRIGSWLNLWSAGVDIALLATALLGA